jgi:hypothetical protein
MVKVMWPWKIVNGMLLDIWWNFRSDRNLSVVFRHVKLKGLSRGKNFTAHGAFEGRNWRTLVQVNFAFVHYHVAVAGKRLVANIALLCLKSG